MSRGAWDRVGRMGLGAAALCLLCGAPAPRGEEALPSPGVTLQQLDGARRIDVVLPGRVLDAAMPRRADGRRDVVALVAPPSLVSDEAGPEAAPPPCDRPPGAPPEPRPKMLILVDAGGGEGLVTLRDDLPGDVESVEAVDLDGDGVEEIVVERPAGLWLVPLGPREGSPPPLERLLTEARLRPRAGGFIRPLAPPGTGGEPPATGYRPLYYAVVPGSLSFYAAVSAGASLGKTFETPLPVETTRGKDGLTIRTPIVRLVGRRPTGELLLAAGPEPYGDERLRTILVEPAAPDPDRSVEFWSRLPSPETLMESAYLTFDGMPAMAVATRPADELSIFREKSLRIFLLDARDRSRAGAPPALAVESHANLWQRITFIASDADRDGRQDLVLGYWKGLKDSRIVLDVYLRLPDGSFARSPRTTEFDVEEGERSMLRYGDDLDGDGRADLILCSAGEAAIFPGSSRSREGSRLMDPKPRWSVPVETSDSFLEADDEMDISLGSGKLSMMFRSVSARWPRFSDLDADGRPEILFAGEKPGGLGSLQVIRLAP